MGFEDRQYYRERSPADSGFYFSNRSIVTLIVIVNVAIFILDAFTPLYEVNGDGTHWLSFLLGIQSDRPWFIWNYLTYGFAHASYSTATSFWHVGGNMFTLFVFGHSVEHTLGRNEFLRFYLISIVVCGLGFTLLSLLFGWQFSFLVGASGGVSAVVALFIFMFPRQTILLFFVLPTPAWILGILLLVQNIFVALRPDSHTAWQAHLIGFAFGAAYFYGRWNFASWQFGKFPNPLRSQPRLKVHDPDNGNDKLKDQADLILQKITEHGESSLTSRERKLLNKYSQQLRKKRS